MKNKFLVVSLAFILLFSLSACGNKNMENVDSNNSTEKQSTSETENIEKQTEQEANSEKDEPTSIEETVLLENEGLKVTATGIKEDKFLGSELNLLIENESSDAYELSVDSLCVNDYTTNALFLEDIAAGKKANKSVTLLNDTLKEAGLKTISKIDIKFNVRKNDEFEYVFTSDFVSLYTNKKDSLDKNSIDTENLILEQNGIKMFVGEINENSIFGKEILFYTENSSKDNVMIHLDNVSVNGFMVDTLYMSTILSGKKSLDKLVIVKDSLEENGIDKIENVEFTVKVVEKDSFETIFETELILTNFK